MPMTSLERLGEKLKAARKKKGLTQQKLADLSHVSLKHIQNCERGKKNPSFEILQALAKVLDISLDSLLAPDMINFFLWYRSAHTPPTNEMRNCGR